MVRVFDSGSSGPGLCCVLAAEHSQTLLSLYPGV